jgi:hypothetical protein
MEWNTAKETGWDVFGKCSESLLNYLSEFQKKTVKRTTETNEYDDDDDGKFMHVEIPKCVYYYILRSSVRTLSSGHTQPT